MATPTPAAIATGRISEGFFPAEGPPEYKADFFPVEEIAELFEYEDFFPAEEWLERDERDELFIDPSKEP